MELVRGEPITEYCDRHRLPALERLSLFAQVCRAVQHAHQKGIIHRDVKPSNVLVTVSDGRPLPKVIDFGIAKATSARLTERTLFTEHRQLVGTPEYMSPEQAEMLGVDVDTRTDVYSLGVLLYELLTGATPFDSGRLRSAAFGELLRIIREEDPPTPSGRLSGLTEHLGAIASRRGTTPERLGRLVRGELDWIVMRALEKDRTRRYETASALAADVERFLRDEPVEAGPPSAVYRLRKALRRHRTAAATAAVVAITLLAATGVSVAFGVEATRQRRVADEHVKVAESEQETTAAILRFVTDKVLAAGSVDRLGPRAMIGEALEAAMGRVSRSIERRPEVEARIRLAAARSFQDMGLFDQSRVNLDAAGEIIERLGDRRLALEHQLQHGSWLVDRGDPLASLAVLNLILFEGMGETDFDHDIRRRAAIQANPAYLQIGRADLSLLQLEPMIAEANASRDADPVVRWDMQSQACTALLALGRYEEAEPLLRTQLDSLDELPIGTVSRRALTERNLGTALAKLGRLDEAEDVYLVALERRRATSGDRHWRIAQIGEAFAELAELRRDMEKAERLRLEAIETLNESGHASGVIIAYHLNNLGMLYLRMGRFADAEAKFAEAIEKATPHVADGNPHVLAFLHNLADIVLRQGRAAEALSIIDRAIEGRVRLYGDSHPGVLGTRAIRARALAALGRSDEAIAAYALACNHDFTINAEVGPSLAEALFQYGLLLSAAGRAAEAEDAFRRLVVVYDQLGMHGHPFYPAAQSLQATALQRLARFAEAEAVLLDAFERVMRLPNATPEQRERAGLRLADLYNAWHAAEPDAGYGEHAEIWRGRASEAKHTAPGPG